MITEKQWEELCGFFDAWVQYDVVKDMSYEDAKKHIVSMRNLFLSREGYQDMEFIGSKPKLDISVYSS